MTMQSIPGARIASLDAVRGFAVCGILLMNIVPIGLPAFAQNNPLFYGTRGPSDMAAWAINFVLSEGKMRALFTMLFGASMVLMAERAEASEPGSAAEAHFHRMFWLGIFGLAHAWLLWFGDILLQYAVCGAIGFVFWRWKPWALWTLFGTMMLVQLAQAWERYGHGLTSAAAHAANRAADAAIAARDVGLYRGDFGDVFTARAPMTMQFQTEILPDSVPEILGFMALGIIFYRNGFLTGAWSVARYRWTIAIGYLIAVPLHLPLIRMLIDGGFAPAAIAIGEGLGLLLRPFVALAHAAAVILLLRSGTMRWLSERLVAAGRMAFSNYLGTTFVTTMLFYGYGFGLYGSLSRAELYIVVLGVWALILGWSKPWLERYRYGPLEWLWRSLARGSPQPMRRPLASA